MRNSTSVIIVMSKLFKNSIYPFLALSEASLKNNPLLGSSEGVLHSDSVTISGSVRIPYTVSISDIHLESQFQSESQIQSGIGIGSLN